MAHAQKPDFVFRRNGRVHLHRRGRQFSRLLAAEVCASAVVMLDTPSSEVVWRVLATHSIRQFPLHFLSGASPCAIRFQTQSTTPQFARYYGRLLPHVTSTWWGETLTAWMFQSGQELKKWWNLPSVQVYDIRYEGFHNIMPAALFIYNRISWGVFN